MSITRRLRPLALVLLALLAACADDPVTPRPGEEPEEMPAEERMAALEAVEGELEALSETSLEGDALNEAIADFLESRTEFEAVGIDTATSSVWARFIDGRLLVIPNNLELTAPAATAPSRRFSGAATADGATRASRDGVIIPHAPHVAPSLHSASLANDPLELPTSRRARLLHTFKGGTGLAVGAAEAITEMRTALEDAGWTVTTGDGSLASLRSISGDGFFYINTHGGGGFLRGDPTKLTYSLQTSTLVGPTEDSLTKADFAAGRVVYMTARNGERTLGIFRKSDTRYAITPAFVDQYMSFSPYAFVFLNACESALESNTLVDAFIVKLHGEGASVVLGWKGSVTDTSSWRAARFLTDRMTGANRFRPELSPHRPFALVPVLDHMLLRGIAGLRAVPASQTGAAFGLLRPTIERLWIDTTRATARTGMLVIRGSFGSAVGNDGGVVVRDGASQVPLPVQLWTPDSIIAVPVVSESAPGFSGDVVVISDGRESNARRLHAWHGTMSFSQVLEGALRLDIGMQFVGRFDPDSVRALPGQAAQASTRPAVFRTGPNMPVATATWSASGSLVRDDCTIVWSGTGSVPSAPVTATRSYIYDLRLEPQPRQLVVRNMQLLDMPGFTVTCNGDAQAPVSFSQVYFIGSGATDVYLRFPVDAQWRLTAVDSVVSGDGFVHRLSWPTIEPIPVYDPHQAK